MLPWFIETPTHQDPWNRPSGTTGSSTSQQHGILFNFEGIVMKLSGPWEPNGESPGGTDYVEADGK